MQFPIVAFILALIFDAFLPLLDMGTDSQLFVQTWHFTGGSLDMAGCRACYGKDNDYESAEIYSQKESRNDVCVEGGWKLPFDATLAGLGCGRYPFALDMMTQMLNSPAQNTTWSLSSLKDVNATFEQRACEPGDACCITSTP